MLSDEEECVTGVMTGSPPLRYRVTASNISKEYTRMTWWNIFKTSSITALNWLNLKKWRGIWWRNWTKSRWH